MSFITININKNHIFFLLLFISYFLRDLLGEFIKYLIKDKKIIFGNSKVSKKTIIDIYILTPSNIFVFFFLLYRKKKSKKK